MATKWKYATIPAAQRLEMLKKGNDELYKEEIARTKDAISNRLAAGLDVSEQMKWADTVSYNHNLKKAQDMGVSADKVAKDGYAERLFGDMTESTHGKTSTPSSPKSTYDKTYYNDYETMTSDEVAQSVKDSYIRGINERASLLSSQYNEYVDKLEKDYRKKVHDAFKEYNEKEKLYEEQRLNKGFSENGGRTLTEKTQARSNLYNYVNSLRDEKNDLVKKAHDELNNMLYDMSSKAMGDIADEYYRYNTLASEQKQAEYEKQRDAAEDDKWWHEFGLEKEKLEKDEKARADELALAREKEENDKLADEKELAFKAAESAKDYEKWLAEFEADKEYNKAKLDADIASDNRKSQLDREKFEYQKAKDASENGVEGQEEIEEAPTYDPYAEDLEDGDGKSDQYKEYFNNCLVLAKRMARLVVYDRASKGYVPKFSEAELLEWIMSFELDDEEKRKICADIGIRFYGE